MQLFGVTALASLSWGDDERKAAILAAGAVGPLVQLLRSHTVAVRNAAETALRGLAANSEPCCAAVAEAGAIAALVQLLPALPERIAPVLAELAKANNERRDMIAAAGGFTALCAAVQRGSAVRPRAAAALALCNLVDGDEQLRQAARAAGSEAAIRQLLSSNDLSDSVSEALEQSLLALGSSRVAVGR